MFLRTRKGKKGYYLDILSAYRNKNGKPTNKHIGSLGPFPSLDAAQIKDLGRKLIGISSPPDIIFDPSTREISRKIIGVPLVVHRIWKQMEIEQILNKIARRHVRLQFNLNEAVLLPVIQRFIEPCSKYRAYNDRDKLSVEWKIGLHHLYRALDILAENKEEIEKMLFASRTDLFTNRLDVVFFDTTTFYFNSQRERGILRKGFSKDGKFSDVQIVFGMMVTADGQPVGYDYFPGNTADVNTIGAAICKLKKTYRLGEVTIVADRGVLSGANLDQIEQQGYNYIVAGRIKKLPLKKREEILNLTLYRKLQDKDDEIFIYQTNFGSRRLVVTWSKKRAQKDAKERQEIIEKLAKRLEHGGKQIVANRYRRFVNIEGARFAIDPKAIEEDARFDGFLCVITNNTTLKDEQIIAQYKQLWKIEETFRLMKSQLEVRPMFHWTEKRIAGHLMMSFLAFTVLRELERKVKQAGVTQSISEVIRELCELQVSQLVSGDNIYLLRSNATSLVVKIFKAVGIRLPPSFTPMVPGNESDRFLGLFSPI